MAGGKTGAGPGASEAFGPVRGKGGAPLLFDEARRGVFLQALRETCHLGRSAAAAGVSSGTVYARRMRDDAFRAALEDALAEGAARLRQEVLDRAIDEAARRDARDGGERSGEVDAAEAPADARAERWLSARLGSTRPRSGKAGAGRRALPRIEVDRRLLEAVERLARGIGAGR